MLGAFRFMRNSRGPRSRVLDCQNCLTVRAASRGNFLSFAYTPTDTSRMPLVCLQDVSENTARKFAFTRRLWAAWPAASRCLRAAARRPRLLRSISPRRLRTPPRAPLTPSGLQPPISLAMEKSTRGRESGIVQRRDSVWQRRRHISNSGHLRREFQSLSIRLRSRWAISGQGDA